MMPGPPVRRRRGSLALRISLLTAAVAIIAALIAGLVGVGLIRRSNETNARSTLAGLASAVQTESQGSGNRTVAERAVLRALKVQFALIGPGGQISAGGTALGRDAASTLGPSSLLTTSVSTTREVDGAQVLIESRPTTSGAVLLAQRRTDALALGDAAIRRLFWALVIGVVVAIGLGLLVAWRLSRPLRRTAAAAHALAAGQRDVAVPPEGPAEVAEVAEALNRLSAALSLSEGRQREFLMSVSHDLRTPLAAIVGYAESMADGVVEPDQLSAVGATLQSEAGRLQRLVTDLLDLARLDAADFRIEPTPVEVTELAGSAAVVWSARCTAAGVGFGLERPPAPLFVYTDAVRLRQVLDGLFENALRVTPAGAPIVLAVRTESGFAAAPVIAIEVRDGGPGLADADLAVAFEQGELYRRYRGVRRVGSGLGLAIVHRLVTRLGATIEAGHAAEGGARFTVRLPALPAPPPGR